MAEIMTDIAKTSFQKEKEIIQLIPERQRVIYLLTKGVLGLLKILITGWFASMGVSVMEIIKWW
jgi:hypothetical protein